jgi:hypothetical protein
MEAAVLKDANTSFNSAQRSGAEGFAVRRQSKSGTEETNHGPIS